MTTQIEPQALAVGTKAPDFNNIAGTGGVNISLQDLAGKFVLLVFYPKDQTPGCTRQLCALRDDLAIFEGLNTVVFGVNQGSLESHERFVAAQNYNFPILVDAQSTMAKAYGAYKDNGGTQRTVYIINPEGTIIFAQQGMPSDEELAAAIRAAS